MRRGTVRPGALVASPVFVGSIALLILNDHVLKSAWPGFVTGKLSDVAGVAMVAVGLTALIRHQAVAFAITAVAFTLLKTVPVVAVWASPLLGGVTLTDPTDVVALLVLPPLWRWVCTVSRRRSTASAWMIPIQVVAISAAVFATTATGCNAEGPTQFSVAADGTLVADTFPMHVSRDGGVTWVEEQRDWPGSIDQRCFSDGVCVDIVRAERRTSLVADDGSISVSYQFTEIDALGSLDRPSCFGGSFADVVVVNVGGTEHVVVAMGWLGVLHAERGEPLEWVAVGDWGVQEQDASDRPLGFDVASATPNEGVGFRLPRLLSWGLVLASVLAPMLAFRWATFLAHRRGRSAAVPHVFVALITVASVVVAGLVVLSVVLEATGSTLTAWALGVFGGVAVALALILGIQAVLPHRSLPPPDERDRLG